MTYKARIQNGAIVLDEPVNLPEGSEVTVDIPARPMPALSESLKDVIGQAKDVPADGSVQHDHYIYGTPKR
jgi:predicted DNA-binding antitoxin AbrB/MazE fold protein